MTRLLLGFLVFSVLFFVVFHLRLASCLGNVLVCHSSDLERLADLFLVLLSQVFETVNLVGLIERLFEIGEDLWGLCSSAPLRQHCPSSALTGQGPARPCLRRIPSVGCICGRGR